MECSLFVDAISTACFGLVFLKSMSSSVLMYGILEQLQKFFFNPCRNKTFDELPPFQD